MPRFLFPLYIPGTMLRQFVKNLTTNWAVYLSAAVISFFLTPYIIAAVGQAAFGVWILVGSFSGYLGLFDFGLGFAVVRFVARYQTTGEADKRNEVVATAFYIAALLGLLVLLATAILMVSAAVWFAIPPELVTQARWAIFLVGLSIAIGFPLSVFSEALAGGLYRFDLFNTVAIATALFRTALTIAALELGWGLVGLGAAALAGSLVGYLWRMRILYRLLPDLSIHPRLARPAVLKRIGGYSLYSFILVLSGRLAFYSDSFVVGIFRGVEDIAIFGIAVKLVEYLRQMVFTMTKLFAPIAARYDPDTDQASLRRFLYDGSRLNLLFSLPLSLLLFFWGRPFIHLWVGDRFDSSVLILQILLIGHLLSFMQGIGGDILLGVGRHRLLALLSLGSAAINVILSVILVQIMGLPGVAWGTTIPLSLLSLLYVPFAAIRLVGGTPLGFLREAFLPPLAASLLPALFIVVVSRHINSLGWMALSLIALGIIYLPSAWLVALKPAEKNRIRSILWPSGRRRLNE